MLHRKRHTKMKEAEDRRPSKQPFQIIDLFAGIGGFSLAGHWRGWETIAFVEKEPYCQKVLAKNFPNVPIHSDIRDYKPKKHAADIICGGFPCQPFSSAGKRKGKEDDRFLWPEMLRVIREAKPTFVVGENVAGILSMDNGAVFEEICLSLEGEGYAVQSFVIPAQAVGAPHRRDRVWIVGYSEYNGRNAAAFKGSTSEAEREGRVCEPERPDTTHGDVQFAAYANCKPRFTKQECQHQKWIQEHPRGAKQIESIEYTANPKYQRQQGQGEYRGRLCTKKVGQGKANWFVYDNKFQNRWYEVATRLCGVHDGLPSWVDRHRTARLKALGNAIVPQVADTLFAAIEQHYIETKGCACT